jgi:hypothetical protein
VEEPTIRRSKKGAAGLEFNKEHAYYLFHMKRVIHHEFDPPNTIVNSDFYCDVLRRLRENVHNHNWHVHHDNAPAHTSLKTTEFVTNNNMVFFPHPPYLPDLGPCDFTVSQIENKTEGKMF